MKRITLLLISVFSLVLGYGQVTTIDFETAGDGYTPSIAGGSNYTDLFNRTDYNLPNCTNEDGFFWGIEDFNGSPSMTIDQIDVTGSTEFTFSIDMVAHHFEDWDLPDELLITYSIDGNSTYQNLMWVQMVPGDNFNGPAALDLAFDGGGDCGATTTLPALTTGTQHSCTVLSSNFATFSTASIPLSGNSTLDILLQFNGLDGTDEGLYFDNIIITETVGSTPTISATPTSITGLGYVVGSATSVGQSFSVSATNLSPAAGNITVTAPTNFGVSTTLGGTYTTSITLPYTSGALAATDVFVNLNTGLALGTYGPLDVAITGGAATASNVAVSGEVIATPPPTITVGSNSMSGFTYEEGSGPSAPQTNTVSWANLVGDVSSLNPVTHFEFSVPAFDPTYQSAGTALNVTIFPGLNNTLGPIDVDIRLIEGLSAGIYIDTIAFSSPDGSGGFIPDTIILAGEVTTPPVVCTPTTVALPYTGISGTAEFSHNTSNPLVAGPQEICGSNFTLSYGAETPGTDGSTNWFGTESGNGLSSADFGAAPASFKTYPIDVSSISAVDINAFGGTDGADVFNGGDEDFTWWYSLDGGAQVPFFYTIDDGSLAATSLNLDVSSASTIQVGFTFEINGGTDGFENMDVTITEYVAPTGVITVPITNVTGFTYVEGSGPSNVVLSSMSALGLVGNVSATNVASFEFYDNISSSWVSDLGTIVAPPSGIIPSTSISVRLIAGLAVGTYNETMTLSATGATSVDVNFVGVVTAPPLVPCAELFISEYGEPSSGNGKYIEIYNPTSVDVDLADYELWKIANGGSWSESSFDLSGTIVSGGVWIVGNNDVDVPNANEESSAVCNFNGDDAVGLAYNGVLIDAIGTEGSDPGDGWDVAGETEATEDKTLRRKASIQVPNTDWASSAGTDAMDSEWEVVSYSQANLGSHVTACVPVSYNWTGTTDTDWDTYTNWSGNAVPTSADIATIPSAGVTNFPVITPAVTLGDITVDAGASLTVATGIVLDGLFTNNGTVTLQDGAYLDDFTNGGASFLGTITVETIAANGVVDDQRFISSPVNTPMFGEIADDLNGPWGAGAQGVNGVAVTVDDCNPLSPTLTQTSNYGNLFEYNETLVLPLQCELDGWVVRSSGALENGRGYSAYLTNGSTFDFTGTPNTGTLQINATNSGSGVTAAEGWNLLGNPYPSAISRDAVVAAGALDVQYFVTSGVYEGSYSAYGIGSNIAIGQGFQAHAPVTGPIDFDNSMRNTNAATWYENENWFEYKLEVSVFGADYADKTTLFYNNEATNSYEPMYDVRKRKSNAGHPTLSTFGANKDLTLNGLSVNDLGETVPMNLDAGANGEFILSFEGKETFPANTTIYVKDLQENVVHNIADGDYTFTANTTDNAERFEIIFIPEVSLATTKEDCEGNAGSVEISNTNFTNNRTFEIIANNNVIATDDLENLNESLTSGTYTVNVNDQYEGTQVYTVEIEAAELIEADFTVSSNELFVGEVLMLNNTTTNSNTIDWTIDNSTITNVNNATYTFEEAGVYEVVLSVSNNECADTKAETITVTNKTTGIETINGEAITFYPNPATDVLYIKASTDINIAIVNVLGKTIVKTSAKTINLENVATGMYIIQVYNAENKLIGTEKLIKK